MIHRTDDPTWPESTGRSRAAVPDREHLASTLKRTTFAIRRVGGRQVVLTLTQTDLHGFDIDTRMGWNPRSRESETSTSGAADLHWGKLGGASNDIGSALEMGRRRVDRRRGRQVGHRSLRGLRI